MCISFPVSKRSASSTGHVTSTGGRSIIGPCIGRSCSWARPRANARSSSSPAMPRASITRPGRRTPSGFGLRHGSTPRARKNRCGARNRRTFHSTTASAGSTSTSAATPVPWARGVPGLTRGGARCVLSRTMRQRGGSVQGIASGVPSRGCGSGRVRLPDSTTNHILFVLPRPLAIFRRHRFPGSRQGEAPGGARPTYGPSGHEPGPARETSRRGTKGSAPSPPWASPRALGRSCMPTATNRLPRKPRGPAAREFGEGAASVCRKR